MITKPTMPQLLLAMQAELTEKIIPGLSDPTLVVNVQMMTAVLGALSVRVEHELSWMRDEGARIEAAAEQVLTALPAADGLADALRNYRDRRTDSILHSDAQADYERASEVLSRIAEAAYASGDRELIALTEELFESRVGTEQVAIGDYVAVGR